MDTFGGWWEFLIILITAIIVIKPSDFPAFMRFLGQLIGRLRTLSYDIQWRLEHLASDNDDESASLSPPTHPSRQKNTSKSRGKKRRRSDDV